MNDKRRKRSERGTILVVTLVAAVLVVGFAYAFLIVSRGEIEGAKSDARREKALQAAEAGVDELIDKLNSGAMFPDPNGIVDPRLVNVGSLQSSDAGLPYSVDWDTSSATADGVSVLTVRSQAKVGLVGLNQAVDPNHPERHQSLVERKVEVVLTNRAIALHPQAAVSCNGSMRIAGNAIVDGRDHHSDGSLIVSADPNHPAGVFAASSSGDVTISDAAQVAGHGHDLTSDPNEFPDVVQQNVAYGDGTDQDGDGRVDEELPDGRDNDSDGLVDEDLSQYPSSPDSLLGLPDGTLKRVAQTQGTYFTSESDFLAYLALNGNQMPGGKILVLDFPATDLAGPILTPMNFGDTFNDEPSILVFHSPYSNSVLWDLHGRFKGFILADIVVHRDGDARILGGIYTFNRDRLGSDYGTGAVTVLYSSEVLAALPLVPYFSPRAWREVAVSGPHRQP